MDELLKVLEPMMEYVCDHLCRYPNEVTDQEELDAICESCEMNKHTTDILNMVQEKEKPKLVIWTPAYQSYFSAGDEAESFCPVCDEQVVEHEDNYCRKCGCFLEYRQELKLGGQYGTGSKS